MDLMWTATPGDLRAGGWSGKNSFSTLSSTSLGISQVWCWNVAPQLPPPAQPVDVISAIAGQFRKLGYADAILFVQELLPGMVHFLPFVVHVEFNEALLPRPAATTNLGPAFRQTSTTRWLKSPLGTALLAKEGRIRQWSLKTRNLVEFNR